MELQGGGCGAQIGVKNPEGRGWVGAPGCSQIPQNQFSSGFPKESRVAFTRANSHVLVPSWRTESTFPMDTGLVCYIPAGNSLKYRCFNLIPVPASP